MSKSTNRKKKRVVVVMPTYNEADNITKMLKVLFTKEFPKIEDAEMHLLVVDDNSPDGTGKIVKEYMKREKKLHMLQGEKQGLGMAYVRGMKYAMKTLDADAVVEMDADFQHDPKYLRLMVQEYLNGADYVIGSRYVEGGSIPEGWEFHRKAVSLLGNLFARTVLWLPKLHDVTTGFRLTKVKGVLDKIELDHLMELKHFAYKIDLFYKSVKLSKKTVEVPIHFAERTMETSKFSMQEMIASYKVVLMLRAYRSKRFVKYGLVGALGFAINAIGIEIFRMLPLTTTFAKLAEPLADVPGLTLTTAPSFWAAALAAELAIISNFTFNNSWTFADQKITSPLIIVRKFLEFNATSLGAIAIQSVVVGGATILFGDIILVRQISLVFAVGFLIIPYNYAMYNFFIWKTWKLPKFMGAKA